MREEILKTIKSAKKLTRFASEDLQNDIVRERNLEAVFKKDKRYQKELRALCDAEGIQPTKYWRGLKYGWRYIECFVEALQMTGFEQKRLQKVLDNPIVGDNKLWTTRQDFESDLGNDDKEAFTELKKLVQGIIAVKNKEVAHENGREIKRNVFGIRSKPRQELDAGQIV